MSYTLIAPPAAPAADRLLTRPLLLFLWLAALGLLLIAPEKVPVSRTQEARVLETARQMLASDAPHPYLIPMLNGQYRLQKPPLAYWLTAASYKTFGVSTTAGRLPAILAGWGTLAVTYLAGTWLFSRRAGLLASAALLSSYLFYRYTRLAETDTLATFFVTASCLLFWKATKSPSLLWFHLAALFAAGAALSKGPPAAFPVLFFLALGLVNRDWKSLRRFLFSGALLTLLAISFAWYAYLASHHLLKQVLNEIDELAAGYDHGGSFLNYLPELLTSTAPWSGFFVAALVFAIQRFKSDPRLRALLIWSAAILVPLCCIGNKQFHYLFPLMPPAMLLTAALLDHALSQSAIGNRQSAITIVFLCTLVTTACAAVALPVTSWFLIHRLTPTDFLLAGLILVACSAIFLTYLKQGFPPTLGAYTRWAAVLMPLILSLWLPPLVVDDYPAFAAQLQSRFGPDASYVSYSQVPKLELCFELSRPIFRVPAKTPIPPGSIPLIVVKHNAPAPKSPSGHVPVLILKGREQDLYVYQHADQNQGTITNP